jgi:hypothetical protein
MVTWQTWHSITVFIGEVLFPFSVSEVFLSELIDWFVGRNNHQHVFQGYHLARSPLHWPGLYVLEEDVTILTSLLFYLSLSLIT